MDSSASSWWRSPADFRGIRLPKNYRRHNLSAVKPGVPTVERQSFFSAFRFGGVSLRGLQKTVERRIVFPVLFLSAGLLLAQPCGGASVGSVGFENTGNLATARSVHTATLLPNGTVLVVGGGNSYVGLASAELYDPVSGTWSTTGSLTNGRSGHTATLLPNGKVLVAGGFEFPFVLASAELYDPASGTWTSTSSLATARDYHTATLLSNGKVLVAGGHNGGGYATSAELYDPASATWTAAGILTNAPSAPLAAASRPRLRRRRFHPATIWNPRSSKRSLPATTPPLCVGRMAPPA